MKKAVFPFLGFTLLLSLSCEKKNIFNPELPPATMTGANTFGCLVNGEVWRPYVETLAFGLRLNVKHDRGWVDCDQLHIGARKLKLGEDSLFQEFNINVWCPILGENKITPSKGVFHFFHQPCGYRYRVDTLSPYIMNITTLDTLNNIASGTFEFTAIHDGCQDTLKITEGRFDADSSL